MRVKSLREHRNQYGLEFGSKVTKAEGDEYIIPDRQAPPLIAKGLIEEVKEKAASDGGANKDKANKG